MGSNGNGKIPHGEVTLETKWDKCRRELMEAFEERNVNPRRFAAAIDDAYNATKLVACGGGRYQECPDHKMRLRAAAMHAAWDVRFAEKIRQLFEETPEFQDIELRFEQFVESARS